MVLIPTVRWAQRKALIYMTLDVQDVKDQKVEVSNTDDDKHARITFSGKAGSDDQDYELDLKLYGPVDTEKSKISISPRHIVVIVDKKEEGSWPRLTAETGKHLTHVKVDWDKWVDSDDEGEEDERDKIITV